MTRTEHVALKGTREGLVLYLDPQADFTVLIDELQRLLKDSAQFLKGAAVRCFGGEREYTDLEKQDLADTLKNHDLEFVGWLRAEDVYVPGKSSSNPVREQGVQRALDEGMTEGNCLFIEKTLRSGKSIQFDGHVVIIGDVNPGAEVIASGNIVVLGAIRGVAHAGATGDRNAIVYSFFLAPTQLRIADLVTRAPEDGGESRGPEIAKIKDNQLVVEGLSINGVKKLLY
ncbi:MAG: septum site-determining protein MinC [Desulfitobacterium hafniense]|nr:septum site-determining protein MinC [Desulfitobacterium hafniense]